MSGKLRVLLTTEGTYPYHQGGVSTWCETLVNRLDSVDYTLYSVLANPFITQKFKLPSGTKLIKVPLWGTEEPGEHLDVPFSQIILAKHNTHQELIESRFLPQFRNLIEEILSPVKRPNRLGRILFELYQYFHEFEYKVSFKSELTWQVYKSLIHQACSDSKKQLGQPDVYSLIQSLGWVYRFLTIINTPVPEVDVTHSSAAAFCGIPCVLAKMQRGTPFLLSEHGIYLREQYLSLSARGYSSFLDTFLIRFIQSVTTLNYAYADQVSPVCEYNKHWETEFGVTPKKIKVIYNGVDPRVFKEGANTSQSQPTVIMIARIDPVKDILTFLRAAEKVRHKVPEARFIVYGSVSVPAYYEQCLELRKQLRLQEVFMFAGHTSNIAAAYHTGDVIVLSSITEAFPYSVVEAMMSGKPVVATDVGGVREAIGESGLVVRPQNPDKLADAIVSLLANETARQAYARDGRERALNFFTIDTMLDNYLGTYERLANRSVTVKRAEAVYSSDERAATPCFFTGQRTHLARAYAFIDIGLDREAISEFRKALHMNPGVEFAPVILTEIAAALNRLGLYDEAFQEMERGHALHEWLQIQAQDSA